MTQTARPSEPSGHLDLDALADVLAGEGGAESTGHLAGCSSCTSRLGELRVADARVVTVLSTLPPPVVPDDLAERLSAALAAQAPLQPAQAGVTALPAAAPRRRAWLPAAAAAVLLVSGAGIGWSLLQDGGSSSDDAASQAAGAEVVVSASGTDYADEAAVAAALPGVLAGESATAMAAPGAADSGAADSGAGARSEGGTEAEAEAGDPAATLSVIDPLERLRTPDGLADCLVALQATPDEAPVEPLAVDYATYAGAPALAVVLDDPDPTKLSVFVVGPACAQADAAVLHFVRVDAP